MASFSVPTRKMELEPANSQGGGHFFVIERWLVAAIFNSLTVACSLGIFAWKFAIKRDLRQSPVHSVAGLSLTAIRPSCDGRPQWQVTADGASQYAQRRNLEAELSSVASFRRTG